MLGLDLLGLDLLGLDLLGLDLLGLDLLGLDLLGRSGSRQRAVQPPAGTAQASVALAEPWRDRP